MSRFKLRRRRFLASRLGIFTHEGTLWVPADADGLVAVWDPSRSQGGQSLEDTYGGNDGQLGSDPGGDANDPSWVSSPPSLLFDGSNDFVDCGGDNDGSFADIITELTVVLAHDLTDAINPSTPGTTKHLLEKGNGIHDGATQYAVRYDQWNRYQAFWYNGGTKSLTGSTYTTSGWHTIAFTGKSGSQGLYVDGSLTASGTQTSWLVSYDTSPLILGARYGPSGGPSLVWPDNVGAVLLYSKHKTEAEIDAIHNDIRASFPGYGLIEAV